MRKSLLKSGVMLAATIALLAPATAKADEPSLALRVEPGVAVPLTSPQTDRFNPGGALSVKPTLALTPWFEANVTLSAMALPSRIDGIEYGQSLGAGVGARLKLPTGDKTGLAAIQPWVDGDAQYIRTGVLDRAALSIGVGATVPTNESKSVRIGPFVRYVDVVESLNDKRGFDTSDGHILIAGLSFEFGAGTVKKAAPPPAPPPVVVPPPAEEPKVEPKPDPAPPPPVAVIEIREKVQFPWDSAVPLPTAQGAMAAALKVLLANPNYKVEVRGHASSEGQVAHNNALSTRRAQAVADFLTKNGVPANNVTVKGFGSSQPVADNATKAGREANRRVEFSLDIVITKAGGSK